jgi:hypothetical protein
VKKGSTVIFSFIIFFLLVVEYGQVFLPPYRLIKLSASGAIEPDTNSFFCVVYTLRL